MLFQTLSMGVNSGSDFLFFPTCPKPTVTQAKQDDYISLRFFRDPVSGQWRMEAHGKHPTMVNIHKDIQSDKS